MGECNFEREALITLAERKCNRNDLLNCDSSENLECRTTGNLILVVLSIGENIQAIKTCGNSFKLFLSNLCIDN